MKKLSVVLVMLVVFLSNSSCSSDDASDSTSPQTQEESMIVGEWTLQSSKLAGEDVKSQNIVKFTADKNVLFTFNKESSDGKDLTEKGTWSLNNKVLTINWCDQDPDNAKYELNVTELSASSLSWKTTIEEAGSLEETFAR